MGDMGDMDDMRETGEVWSLTRVWVDAGGGSWLVSFNLAMVGDWLQCVGFSVRSYIETVTVTETEDVIRGVLKEDGPVESDEDGKPVEDLGEAIYWTAVKAGYPSDLAAGELWGDQEPALAVLEGGGSMKPRELLTGILRQIPFASLLAEVRQREAARLRGEGRVQAQLDDPALRPSPDTIMITSNSPVHRWFEQPANAMMPPGNKVGRRRKYSFDDLRQVASIYSDAMAHGQHPTKAVAETMGLTADQAAKLVARCRRPDVGLLGPTEKRKAGGARPPNLGPSRESGQS